MAFPQSFLDEIKNRVAVSDVVGRRVKLQRRGIRQSAPLP
jgi:DNA primase